MGSQGKNSGAGKQKRYEIDMTSGPLLHKLVIYAIPLVFSGILQLLFNAADIIVVGQFAGPLSIAAVGATGSLINLLVSLFLGLSVGVNVLIARYYALKQDRNMEETVSTAVTFSVLGGAVLAVIGILLAEPMLGLMRTPEDVIHLSALYMRIYFAGMPVQLLYNFGASVLRAVGDTRRPLYFLITAGVINVILNLLFVIAFHMDVAGVALATILSQAVSAVLVVRCLLKTQESYRLDLRKLRIVPEKLLTMIQIGLPAGLQSCVFSISNIVIQSSVNSFGSTVIAANSAAANLEGFIYMAMNAMYQTCITFVSANYGVHAFDRVKKAAIECVAMVTVIGGVLGFLFITFGHSLLSIYTPDEATIGFGLNRMKIICPTYFLCGIMDTLCGGIRGLGYAIIPMAVSIVGACVFRLVWIATIFQAYHTQEMLYLSYPVTWTLTAAGHLICFIIIYRRLKKQAEALSAQN